MRAALRVTALPATSPYPGSRREPARARGGPRRPAAARAYCGARGTRRSHAPGGHAGHSCALAVPGGPRCAEPRSRGCVRRGPAFPGGRGPVRTPGAGAGPRGPGRARPGPRDGLRRTRYAAGAAGAWRTARPGPRAARAAASARQVPGEPHHADQISLIKRFARHAGPASSAPACLLASPPACKYRGRAKGAPRQAGRVG